MHELLPDARGCSAARHVPQGRVIVVPDPHADHQSPRVADEERVAIVLCRPGLAEIGNRERGGAARAAIDGGTQHGLDILMVAARKPLLPVHQAFEPAFLLHRKSCRLYRKAIARDARIGGGQLHQRHRGRAEREAGIALRQVGLHAQVARHVDHRIVPHLFPKAHGGDVARTREPILQRDAARIVLLCVLGAIGSVIDGGVVDQVVGRKARPQCREIDEQLERAARLAFRLSHPVEGGLRVILAADHGDDLAIGSHRDQRDLCAAQPRGGDRLPCYRLHPAVERGGQRRLRVIRLGQRARLRQRPVGEIGSGRKILLRPHVEPGRLHPRSLGRIDIASILERSDHHRHASGRAIVILRRVQPAGCLHQPRQHRRLFGREVLRLAVEIVQARRSESVHIGAEIGVGEIAREDIVLVQPRLHPEGDQRLARLAGYRLFGREEGELGELLGNGRAAAVPGPSGACDAARVDTPMGVEPPVLDREECVDHVRRQVLDLDRLVHHRTVARDRRAVRRQQGDFRRRDGLQRLGQRRGDGEIADQQHEDEQQRGEDAARPPELPALRLGWLAVLTGKRIAFEIVEIIGPLVVVRIEPRIAAPVMGTGRLASLPSVAIGSIPVHAAPVLHG